MQKAFTLIELLVVVTIIVVLLALLAPGLDRAVESAQRARCGGNLHAWGLSLRLYAADNHAAFPDNSDGYHTNWVGATVVRFFEHYLVPYKVLGSNEPLDCPTQTYVRAIRESGGYPNPLVGYYFLPAHTLGGNNGMTYNPPSNPDGNDWVTKRRFGQLATAPILMDMKQSISQDGNNHEWYSFSHAMSSHVAGREDGSPDGGNFLFEDGAATWYPTEQMSIGAFVSTYYAWYKIPAVGGK